MTKNEIKEPILKTLATYKDFEVIATKTKIYMISKPKQIVTKSRTLTNDDWSTWLANI